MSLFYKAVYYIRVSDVCGACDNKISSDNLKRERVKRSKRSSERTKRA